MSPGEWQEAGLITPSQADAIERLVAGRGGAATAELDRWAELGILTPSQLGSIRSLQSTRLQAAAPASTPEPADPAPPEPAPLRSVLTPRVHSEPRRPAASRTQSLSVLQIDMRQLGMLLTVLALAGVAGNLLGVMTDVFIAPWRLMGADIEDLLHVAGAILGIGGGLAMYRGLASGPWLAVAGLLLNMAVTLAFAAGRLSDPLVYLALGLWGGLIVLTLRSRRREA